ncbi:MAG: hypothetical protein KGM42_05610 [Hyphomicrobiales bacterium]|nr:hypothetical protein [Hyphomicrobiales bacterium]
MAPIDQPRKPKPSGAPPWMINLIVAGLVVILLAVMVRLAHSLTQASNVIDCAARGIRNCG